MKPFNVFLFAIIFLTLTSCSIGTETTIHNQLDDTLIIEINNNSYELMPNRLVEVSYKYGENRIKSTYKNNVIVDTIINITRNMTENGALINATGKPYYIMTERYGGMALDNSIYDQINVPDSLDFENNAWNKYVENRQKQMAERLKIVMIDSVAIIGDIKTIPANQIVIPRDWYYHVNSKFEESIEVYDSNESIFGKSIRKIFAEKELLEYWMSQQQ